MSTTVIPDQELRDAFANTDFGGVDHRKLLEASVLKKAAGLYCGHTITTIMLELRLIGRNGNILRRGQRLLGEAFKHLMITGG